MCGVFEVHSYFTSLIQRLFLHTSDLVPFSLHSYVFVTVCFSQKALTWSYIFIRGLQHSFCIHVHIKIWIRHKLLSLILASVAKKKRKSMKLAIQKDPQMNALHSAEEIQVCCT